MATTTANTASLQSSPSALRLQMEELLFDFYSVVGIVSPRPYAVSPADLLADEFEGRFFSHTTSQLLAFNKAQLLAAPAVRNEESVPSCDLFSLNSISEQEGVLAISYRAAFRRDHTVTVRTGSMKVVHQGERWILQALDEQVRIVVNPEAIKRRQPADRPRIWIV